MKRLGIYFFFDKEGRGREYNFFYVRELKKIADFVLVVVNGQLDGDSKRRFAEIADEVFIRENIGFDVWAYKQAMEHIGWKNIYEYDELILSNFTCYGPIYPFSEMFDEMSRRKCDFWGAAKHPEQKNFLLPNNVGWIYEHIMSYFIVVRKNMLCHDSFKKYWDNIPQIKTKTESTAYHETVFTRHFEKLGFKSESFIDLENYRGRCNNGSIFYANEFLIKDRCPIVKRRAFFFPFYDNILDSSDGHQAHELMAYITKYTDYNENMIWDDILETQDISSVIRNMQLYYIMGDSQKQKIEVKLLIILGIKFRYQVDIINNYFLFKESVDKFVFFVADEVKDYFLSSEVAQKNIGNIFICNENLFNIYDLICKYNINIDIYDYICCIDIVNIPNKFEISLEDYYRNVIINMIGAKKYIYSIINKFIDNPKLGLCLPIPENFANYFSSILVKDKTRLEYINKIIKINSLSLPECREIISYDNIFWATKDIFNAILDIHYKIGGKKDDIISFLLPYIAQNEKKYTAFIQSLEGARTSMGNMLYMMKTIQKTIYSKTFLRDWSFRGLKNILIKADLNPEVIQKKEITTQKRVHSRDIKDLLKKYINQKYFHKKNKNTIKKVGYLTLRYCELADGRITFLFLTDKAFILESYIECGIYKFYPKKIFYDAQKRVLEYFEQRHAIGAFFEVPLDKVKNNPIVVKKSKIESYYIRWTGPVSYNALEFKKYGLHVRVCNNSIYVEDSMHFNSRVLIERHYTMRDKLIFLGEKFLIKKKYILFSENMSGNDNAFELFKYALKYNKNCYFVANKEFKDGINDKNIYKHVIIYDSNNHIIKLIQSRLWITSFSLRIEMFPKRILKDIHYYNIPSKWYFVPHGVAVGDKDPIICHKFSWDRPEKTFCCNELEQQQFSEEYEFVNVSSYGAPRMDKWYGAILDKNKIIIFFTWRFSLSGINQNDLYSTAYFRHIISIAEMISKEYKNADVYYVFHHEVIRNGFDETIKNALAKFNFSYIDYKTAEGREKFNKCFREAKYLVTDYSSVAYDFAYKEGSIPIYYINDDFISGHYPLNKKFYDIHLGILTKSISELKKALLLDEPTDVMKSRREKFFKYIDGNNSRRVFESICNEGKK